MSNEEEIVPPNSLADAEREERILRARTGVNSAESGAHAGNVLDERDAFIEVGTPDQNVIQQFGNSVRLRCL